MVIGALSFITAEYVFLLIKLSLSLSLLVQYRTCSVTRRSVLFHVFVLLDRDTPLFILSRWRREESERVSARAARKRERERERKSALFNRKVARKRGRRPRGIRPFVIYWWPVCWHVQCMCNLISGGTQSTSTCSTDCTSSGCRCSLGLH